ncbi:MAG: glycogen synthase GlgA [Candidatus Hodarchaeales archaeon]|jgi:starch synthase
MRVAIFASEMDPYIKTGGLADVISALPNALSPYVKNIDVFIPNYRDISNLNLPVEDLGITFGLKIGGKKFSGKVLKIKQKGANVYLIDNYQLFRIRSQLYVKSGKDYRDNLDRFVFFSRGALSVIEQISKKNHYDVFHCHDWQTALIPLYTKINPFFRQKRPLIVFTIHNLAFQGKFPRSKFNILGIPEKYLHPDYIETWGQINLMKAGLTFSDEITTVSPTYAKEIQTKALGVGLHETITLRKEHLTGILNGVDYSVWNTDNNINLPAKYSAEDLSGKKICKKQLQKFFDLPTDPDIPILGVVSRLAWQKGMDLILEVLPELLKNSQLQFVLLGSGDSQLENQFLNLSKAFPDKVGIKIGFGQALAHIIEAGIDIFLMPSRYEPCGLNDKYSLKYGSVPIVHYTGGLADSVIDYQKNPTEGTGFIFREFKPGSFNQTILNALKLFQSKPTWKEMMKRGMQVDFSWSKAAEKYIQVYNRNPA